jgi:methyl-accepting chemotaxis protein
MIESASLFTDFRSTELIMKWNNVSSLKWRLMVYFLVLALLPIIGISIANTTMSKTNIEKDKRIVAESLAAYQADSINDWFHQYQSQLELLATNGDIRSLEVDQVEGDLKGFVNYFGETFETLFVADFEGNVFASSDGSRPIIADRAYFKEILSTHKPTFSDAVESKVTGNVVFIIAVPIIEENEMIAVLGGSVTAKHLGEMLNSMQIGETGEVYLVSREGYFVTDSRFTEDLKEAGLIKERTALELKIETEGLKEAKEGTIGISTYEDYRGVPVLGAYTRLDNGWTLLVEQELAEVHHVSSTIQKTSLLAAGLIAIIAILAANLLSNNVAKPIQQLSKIAKGLALGQVTQEIRIHRKDEVGELADSFRQMVAYQKEIADASVRLAGGDLTAQIQPKCDGDTMGHAFAQMLTNLRYQITQVAESAQALQSASLDLAFASQQAGQATAEIAATVQQAARGSAQQAEALSRTACSVEQMSRAIDGVARGAQEQANGVSQVSEITSQINESVSKVAAYSDEVTQGALKATESAKQGSLVVTDTIRGMGNIKVKVAQSVKKVREMGEQSGKIGSILETIDDIAAQTNLLALNAAIEAARAGEHGKGFAVVADEVRKLAERSRDATSEVGALIHDIQNAVAEAVQAMNEGEKEVNLGESLAQNAGGALEAILNAAQVVHQKAENTSREAAQMHRLASELVGSAETVSAVVEENTAATEEMSAGANEVTQAIESIASVSEENNAFFEEVSASAAEMTAQVDNVSDSAQSLAEMAKVLQGVVARFQLGNVL